MHVRYQTVALPKSLAERFYKIAHFWGYRTFSELVVESARAKILEMEKEFEKAQEEKEE